MAGDRTGRFCVFCGNDPTEKTREHILPRWLLELTGDPRRVVQIGIDIRKNQPIRFAWSAFVAPACHDCNSEFCELENSAKGVIEALLRRDPLRAQDYILLLDWLDKVRIGLWLAYHFVQNNPTGIEPTFQIKTRMRRKDRLVAVYPIEGDSKGLNTYGAESLLFHRSPSCFSLRINNLLLVNMSADFLISARCGFPFPRVRQLTLDKEHGFTMAVSDFVQHSRIRHPILRKPLHKPSVLLLQPVLQVPLDELERSGYSIDNAYIQAHSVDERAGILLRQFADRVHSIENLCESIEFDRIVGRDSRPLYDLIAQVYEHQNELQSQYQLASKDARRLRRFTRLVKLLMRANSATANYLRSQPPVPT